MGVLAIFYAVSLGLVILLGEETLYDREKKMKPTEGASKLSIMIGIAGVRAKGQTSMASVAKHLLELSIRPQLLLPGKYHSGRTSSITALTSFSIVHSIAFYVGNRHCYYRDTIHSPSSISAR